MKLLINEQQLTRLLKGYIKEEYNDIYDWFEFQNSITMEIFQNIKNQEKVKLSGKINPNQYQAALNDFMKHNGQFNRFPVKYVYRWKGLVLENIAILEVLTSIHGHTSHFPFDDFYDTFNESETYQTKQYNLFTGELDDETIEGEYTQWAKQKYEETKDKDYLKEYNFDSVYTFLEEVYNLDNYVPFFSNGQPVLSDFGLEPLTKLGERLIKQNKPEDIIVTINKILDITHMRSDLAELFIVGGSNSLDKIAGFEKTLEYS